jgi:hypothetical protein
VERPLSEVAPPDALRLSFTVRIVRTEEHLSKAVDIRARSYARHFPEFGERFKVPEEEDRAPFSLVLLAESKSDSEALGTLRIETNLKSPLPIEGLLPSDSQYSGKTVAFVTRLGVKNGPDASLVKLTLFKALHRYCLAAQIDWIVVVARPPMDRQYLRLGFLDIYDDKTLVPIRWSGDIPMRLMALETITCEREWRRSQHPLYRFMFLDYCPDIEVFSSVTGVWGRPRSRAAELPTSRDLEQVFGVSLV